MGIFSKLRKAWYLLRTGWIIGWRSIAIIVFSRLKPQLKHNIVNHHTRNGARQLLKVIKAKYELICDYPLQLEAEKHYIFMSNHQSLLDLPLIFATLPGTIRLIAKQELFHIPVFGKALASAGCIGVDRLNPGNAIEFINSVKEKFNKGMTFWIFPEGTRSRINVLLPLKAGGFRLAREMSAAIIPVAITGTSAALPPGKLNFFLNKQLKIRIGKPIDTINYANVTQQKALMDDVASAITQLMNANN